MNQWTGIEIDGIRYIRVNVSELEPGDINVDRDTLISSDIGEYLGRVRLEWSDGTVQYLRYYNTLLIDASTVE